jgi:hypothetical protein
MADRDWLDSFHPVYTANAAQWERDEARFHGGPAVLHELRRFETDDGDYCARQREAIYLAHMEATAQSFVGHLVRELPTPDDGLDFGGLGEVARRGANARPTPAELVYYNADGAGSDGQQWGGFWGAAMKRAMGTGHRWILVEASPDAPRTQADELRGMRPYLVELSPLEVTNWHVGQDGALKFAVIRVGEREPVVKGNTLEGNGVAAGYYLHVAAGYQGLGAEYQGGGWWRYDGDKQEVARGDYSRTGGMIPLFPLYGEKARGARRAVAGALSSVGRVSLDPLTGRPAGESPVMSRSLLWGIGQADVAIMNAMSIRAFDAWDAGMSRQYLLGIDKDGWELFREQTVAKARVLPLIAPMAGDGTLGSAPGVVDGSMGAVASQVFDSLIASQLEAIDKQAVNLATSTPDSSGLSKRAGFAEAKSPRLANLAENLESAMNTALMFLEMRWGIPNPSAYVTLARDYDLAPLTDDIDRMFDTLRAARLSSPTLEVKMVTAAARQRRVLQDDEVAVVEAELAASADERSRNAAAEATLEQDLADAVGPFSITEPGEPAQEAA